MKTVLIGLLVPLLLLALFGGPAAAHEVGVSRSTWQADRAHPERVQVELALARGEALEPTSPAFSVHQGGRPCPGRVLDVGPAEADGVVVRADFTCDEPVATLDVRADFLERLAPGHRHLLSTADAPGPLVLHGRERTASLNLAPATASSASASGAAASAFDLGAVVTLGVEHILTGFDHLVFLLGLLLVGGRLRTLLGIVTAFTVAHSLTLAAAATGLLTPPPALVEAAIAGSILYVGLENFFVREPRHRWRLTFVFGLVHGFGFAGALAEIGLKDHLVPTLLGFNLGVEAGQLAVLAVALPLLMWARRSEGFRLHGVRLASLAVALAGGLWLVERVA
jgi:hydrogenase/urease accessory protein HupE